MLIEPNEYELTSFALRAPTFTPSQIDFFIGTASGKVFYLYKKWLVTNDGKDPIHEDLEEGPVTSIVCNDDLVAWSTATKIRLIHYSRKQKICLIERPKRYPTFPDYLYTTAGAKPFFFWKKDEGANMFHVVWLNLIKICRLREKEDKRFHMDVIRK